jgi:hypothetical protein
LFLLLLLADRDADGLLEDLPLLSCLLVRDGPNDDADADANAALLVEEAGSRSFLLLPDSRWRRGAMISLTRIID